MKNECSKKLKLCGMIIVLLFLQASVNAGYYLPESSLWQGARYYNQDNVYAYVEYAVYDTASADYHSIFDGELDGFENPGSGQYIYAYEILNLGSDFPPITAFTLLGGDASLASGIGFMDDGDGGLMGTNDGSSFVWEFENGIFVVNEHSAFLVFSSDSGPIAGDFEISTLDEYGDEPPTNGQGEDIPEPATMSLLAAGIWALARKKKNSLK